MLSELSLVFITKVGKSFDSARSLQSFDSTGIHIYDLAEVN